MLYDNIAVKLISKSLSSKDWWSTLKSFITTTNKTCIPSIEYNGIIFSSEHDKANILNSFFDSQSLLNDRSSTSYSSNYGKIRVKELLQRIKSNLYWK